MLDTFCFIKCTMEIKICLLFLLSLIAPLSCIVYRNCGSDKAELLDVRVSKCEDETRCPVGKRTPTKLEIVFKPLENIDSVTVHFKVKIKGFLVPNVGVSKNGCVNSGLACPLEAGKTYTYNSTIDGKGYFRPVQVEVFWKMMNKKDVIVCVRIPTVQI